MPKTGFSAAGSLARRKPPFQIVIARGSTVRRYTIQPFLLRMIGLGGAGLVATCLMMAAYIVFHDDLIAASINRQAHMRAAYEDRIATLRADIDRLTSRLVLDQRTFDERLDALLARQAALDERQDIIAGLSQAARRGGFSTPYADANETSGDDKATGGPLTTGSIAPIRPGQQARLAFAMLRRPGNSAPADPADATAERIDTAATRLDALAEKQAAYVDELASGVGERVSMLAKILKRLGHPLLAAGAEADTGGPFVPLLADSETDTFRRNASLVAAELGRLAAAKELVGALPFAKPVRNASISSGFGRRVDPFLGRPALHTGIDFRVDTGFPVRSTAPGTVVAAEYNAGYGNMVEIDHGNGVSTRFGHLSRILVAVGEALPEGVVIGRAGSTGRSTGPHLHYEIRVDGKAIDPIRYIRAGAEIDALL